SHGNLRVTSRARDYRTRSAVILSSAQRCRGAFLREFSEGFRDATYVAWERGYKWEAHERWQGALNRPACRTLLRTGRFADIAHGGLDRVAHQPDVFLREDRTAGRRPIPRRRSPVRDRPVRLPPRPGQLAGAIRALVRGGRVASQEADTCVHVADRDGLRVHR